MIRMTIMMWTIKIEREIERMSDKGTVERNNKESTLLVFFPRKEYNDNKKTLLLFLRRKGCGSSLFFSRHRWAIVLRSKTLFPVFDNNLNPCSGNFSLEISATHFV